VTKLNTGNVLVTAIGSDKYNVPVQRGVVRCACSLLGFPVEGRRSVAPPHDARGWARPPCRHFKIQSCCCLEALQTLRDSFKPDERAC
jgi:hypothetical protein